MSAAFDRICRICPQVRDYYPTPDYFSSALHWTPYTLYFNQQYQETTAYSTDRYGIRPTYKDGRSYGLEEFESYKGRKGVVVGSSFVFGVGASSDGKTLTSNLSNNSDLLYLNLGGRSHNHTQELITLYLHLHRFQDIEHVIFVSGINDLELFHSSNPLSFPPEWFFFQKSYFQKLRPSLLQRLKTRARSTPKGQSSSARAASTERRKCFEMNLRRGFSMMELLVRKVPVFYALQPFAVWVAKSLTPEEQQIFDLLDELQGEEFRSVLEAMKTERAAYPPAIRSLCASTQIPFIDLNDYFQKNEWYFVDRVHMSDLGYAEAARLLLQHVAGETPV